MKRLTSVHGECLKCVGCIEQSNCDTECSAVDDCIEKLKIYEDLEEQGLLLRLPCREVFETSGDTVFLIFNGEILEVTNLGVSLSTDGKLQIAVDSDEATFPYREPDATLDDFNDWCTNIKQIELSEWGSTLFSTRESAEAALAEQESRE